MLNTYKSGLIQTWQIPQPFSLLTTLENITVSSPKNRGESFLNVILKPRWRSDEERITDDAVDIMKTITLFEKGGIRSMNLSGGQQKLLELERSMMSGATMILMDEPIAGVNPKLAHEIFKMITKICCDRHIAFLIVEHRLDIALQYAHHVFALNRGKIIMQGKPDAVVKHPEVIESYLGR